MQLTLQYFAVKLFQVIVSLKEFLNFQGNLCFHSGFIFSNENVTNPHPTPQGGGRGEIEKQMIFDESVEIIENPMIF